MVNQGILINYILGITRHLRQEDKDPFFLFSPMKYTIFDTKILIKWNKELLELHKRCCKTYLIQRSLKPSRIKQFFVVYDYYITENNIHEYFCRPIHIFVQALILDQLDKISNYITKNNETKRNKRKLHKR